MLGFESAFALWGCYAYTSKCSLYAYVFKLAPVPLHLSKYCPVLRPCLDIPLWNGLFSSKGRNSLSFLGLDILWNHPCWVLKLNLFIQNKTKHSFSIVKVLQLSSFFIIYLFSQLSSDINLDLCQSLNKVRSVYVKIQAFLGRKFWCSRFCPHQLTSVEYQEVPFAKSTSWLTWENIDLVKQTNSNFSGLLYESFMSALLCSVPGRAIWWLLFI